jgi:uncharacterized protein
VALALYEISIPAYLQTLGAVGAFMEKALVEGARRTLQQVAPEAVNAREGADMAFEIRGTTLPFTAEGFVLSFSLPNFYFHATTAYDILRSKGVPVGKRDYLGRLRLKS